MANDIVTLWERSGGDEFASRYVDRIIEASDLKKCHREIEEATVYSEVLGPNGIDQIFRYHDGSIMCIRNNALGK